MMDGESKPIMHFKNLSLENIEGEIWKSIPGFETLYEVSNMGRVKSLFKTIRGFYSEARKEYNVSTKREMIKKQKIDRYGYNVVNPSKPVFQYDLNGNLIKRFDSVTLAGYELGVKPAGISQYIFRKNKINSPYRVTQAYGYHWQF